MNKLLLSLLFPFYLVLSMVRFVWPAQLLTSFVLLSIGILALVLSSQNNKKIYISIFLFIGMLVFSFLLSSLFVARTERIGHVLLFIISSAGIALILVKGYVSRFGVYIIFYGLSTCFLFLIATGVSARDALTASSYNGISMMMLVTCISLYVVLGGEGRKIDLKPAFLTVFICTWAIGRSGILSSLFLLTGLLLLKFNIRFASRFTHLFIFVLLLALGYYFIENLSGFSEGNFILENAAANYMARNEEESSTRLFLWLNYLNNLDLFRIFFGANIFTDYWPAGEEYNYNYHSSWINLHYQTGLMALVFFFLMALALLKYWKENRLFFVLFLTMILRWSTDGIFFESWDFTIYFFIFYYLSGKADMPDRRGLERNARS